MLTSSSKVSLNKGATCPRRVSKRSAPAPVSAHKNGHEAGKAPWASAPMAFVSAAVLLSSGAANAVTLASVPPGQGWGIEALQKAWGGDGAARQVKNLPVSVPNTGKLQEGAGAVKNAVEDAAGAAQNTFQTGGGAKSVQDVVQGAASQIQAGTKGAPDVFSSGAQKAGRVAEDAKGALQGGAENVNRLVNRGPGSDLRRTGAEKAKEVQQGAQEIFQSSDANVPEPFSTGADKAKQAAEQAKDSIQSGADQVQRFVNRNDPSDAIETGSRKAQQAAQGVQDKAKQTARGAQEAFQSSAADLSNGQQKYDKQTTNPDPTQQDSFQDKLGRVVGGGVKDEFLSGNQNLTQANADQLDMRGGVPLNQKNLNTSAALQTGSYNAVDNARERAVAGDDTREDL